MNSNLSIKMLISCIFLFSTSLFAEQPIIGKWLVPESGTGKLKAIVEFKEESDRTISGTNIKILDENLGQNSVCSKCPEPFKNKPLLGSKVIWNLKPSTKYGEYIQGYALDVTNGKIYKGKAKVTQNGRRLSMRGYIGSSLLGRTETWIRATDE